MAIGAIVVPTYVTNTEDDHFFIMDHSGASAVITSGSLLGARIALAASRTPGMHTMILMDDDATVPTVKSINIQYWNAVIDATDPLADLDQRIAAQKPDDVCCFIYTSGTGGRPKGVMLTHRSIQAYITAAMELLERARLTAGNAFCRFCPCRIPMNIPLACICPSSQIPRFGSVRAPNKSPLIWLKFHQR